MRFLRTRVGGEDVFVHAAEGYGIEGTAHRDIVCRFRLPGVEVATSVHEEGRCQGVAVRPGVRRLGFQEHEGRRCVTEVGDRVAGSEFLFNCAQDRGAFFK